MSNNAAVRDRILSRIGEPTNKADALEFSVPPAPRDHFESSFELLKKRMEENRAEFHEVKDEDSIIKLIEEITEGKENPVVFASEKDFPKLSRHFDSSIPENVNGYFKIDISISKALAAPANVGTIVLSPDEQEPRLASLVPPIHMIILNKSTILPSVEEYFSELEKKGEAMPTNLLFISGPSKTADLGGKLCFGIHGPTRLIVGVIDDL